MSTKALEIVRSELRHMLAASEGMEVRLLEGDAKVHRDVLLRPGDEFPETIVGRGGTDFDAYFSYMRQYVHDDATRPDIVIVYTDGYAPGVQQDNRLPLDIPVIWLLTPEHDRSSLDGYGEVIVCDSTHNHLYD